MNALDRIRRDHDILRAKLRVVEGALRMGPEAWYVLRELCFTLARQLRDHIRREEELVERGRASLGQDTLAQIALAHHDEPHFLRMINRLLLQGGETSFHQVRAAFTGFIDGLREHMDREEADVLPLLEDVCGLGAPPEAVGTAARPDLNETMTVIRILRLFPSTKPIFARCLINLPFEGSDCLDEVAWRHGMESEQLLSQLKDAIR